MIARELIRSRDIIPALRRVSEYGRNSPNAAIAGEVIEKSNEKRATDAIFLWNDVYVFVFTRNITLFLD